MDVALSLRDCTPPSWTQQGRSGSAVSGVVPIALALIGDLFPFQERGRPLGWLFGAMAGGMALGSTAGVMLEPFITWRGTSSVSRSSVSRSWSCLYRTARS